MAGVNEISKNKATLAFILLNPRGRIKGNV
jgi:hypothetical protein